MPFHSLPDSYTKLLIHADDVNGSTTFTDSSDSPHTITRDANVDHDSGNKIFGASSIYIPKGNRLQIADSTDWQFGTGDFTIDFWAKCWNTTDTRGLFNYFKDANNRYQFSNYSNLDFYCNRAGSSQNLSFTHTRDILWHHYAVVLSGTVLRIYVDGVKKGENTSFTQDIDFTGGTFYIGARTDDGSDFNTYSAITSIDEFRVSKGIARWISDFTPPTKPYSKIDDDYHMAEEKTITETVGTAPDSNTKLLIHSDHTNNSINVYDSSLSGHAITVNADTKHSTGASKFGATSLRFDGTADYLAIADSSDWDFGTGDFTIDFWSNIVTVTGNTNWISRENTSTGHSTWFFRIESATKLTWANAPAENQNQWNYTEQTGVWKHYAIVRHNGTVKIYINGTLSHSVTDGNNYTSNGGEVYIGARKYSNTVQQYIDAYIDELRVSKGVARWTTNFTPPTKQYDIISDLSVDKLNVNKVGIGTTTPSDHYSDELVIACADEGGVTLVGGTTHKQYINFADGTSGDDQYRGGINYDHNTNALALRCNGADPVSINSSGNATFTGGVTLAGGSIADASMNLHSNNYVYIAGGTAGLALKGKNSDDAGITMTNATQNITLFTNNTTRLEITNSSATFSGTLSTGTDGAYGTNIIRGATYFYIDADSILEVTNQGGNATGVTAGSGDGLYIGANGAAGGISINTSQQCTFPQNATFQGGVTASAFKKGSKSESKGTGNMMDAFTMENQPGCVYIVHSSITGSDSPSNYNITDLVYGANSTYLRVTLHNANSSLMTSQMQGSTYQVSQSSGTTQTITSQWFKIG